MNNELKKYFVDITKLYMFNYYLDFMINKVYAKRNGERRGQI
jgi:hypothetical protein